MRLNYLQLTLRDVSGGSLAESLFLWCGHDEGYIERFWWFSRLHGDHHEILGWTNSRGQERLEIKRPSLWISEINVRRLPTSCGFEKDRLQVVHRKHVPKHGLESILSRDALRLCAWKSNGRYPHEIQCLGPDGQDFRSIWVPSIVDLAFHGALCFFLTSLGVLQFNVFVK